MTTPPITVFQVATGNVGSEMIKRIQTRPDLKLVGVHCYSPEKIGRDVGELVGIGPVASPPPAASRTSSPPSPTC